MKKLRTPLKMKKKRRWGVGFPSRCAMCKHWTGYCSQASDGYTDDCLLVRDEEKKRGSC